MLVASALVFACAVAQDVRLDWVLDHEVALRSVDPGDDDFADLEPLVAAIGDARVVQFGEPSHGDGTTFLAKGRLIRFLNQRLGFDVLAFESGLFDCSAAEKKFAQPEVDALGAAEEGVFPIWTSSEQCRPLFEYVRATHGTKRPLEIAGFDCQFTGRAAVGWVEWLAREATRLGVALADDERARLAAIQARIQQLSQPTVPGVPAPAPTETAASAAPFLSGLEARFAPSNELARDDVAAARGRRFVARTLRNCRIEFEVAQDFAGQPADDAKQQHASNLRDATMGENLVWLANEWFPGRKIVAWAASRHVAHDLPKVQLLGSPANVYASYVAMGDIVHRDLGAAAYTILFTAARGSFGSVFNKTKSRLDEPAAGSLEDLFDRAGPPLAFLDLRAARDEEGAPLRAPFVARPFGYAPGLCDWSDVADAFVFTADMAPSTPRAAPPKAR